MAKVSVALWTLVLLGIMIAWTYWEVKSMHIYYQWHDYLVDQKTGARLEPRELIQLSRLLVENASYINETSSLDRLHDQVFQTNLAKFVINDQVYSDERELRLSGWPVSNQTLCGQQLAWIAGQLEGQLRDYQLAAGQLARQLTNLMDTFGKLESGTFDGQVFWAGSYEACQKARLDSAELGRISMRYCVAKMRFKWWPAEERVFPKPAVRIGACLPEACDTLSFAHHGEAIERLVKLELPEFYRKHLLLHDLFCLPDERSPIRRLPLASWLFLAACLGWLLLVLAATIRQAHSRGSKQPREAQEMELQAGNLLTGHHQQPKPEPSQAPAPAPEVSGGWLELISLQYTWRQFLKAPGRAQRHETPRLDMRAMNLVKSLMAMIIVIAHAGLLVVAMARVLGNHVRLGSGSTARFFASFPLLVDTFFMLFGLLVAYSMIKQCSERQLASPLLWLKINVNLMARVWPLFALTYCFERLVAPYLGAGPLWDYGVYSYSPKGICMHETWLKSIPQLGRTGDPALITCVGPAWFLVVYTQVGLLLPLIVYLIHRLPTQTAKLALLVSLNAIGLAHMALRLRSQVTVREEAFAMYGILGAVLMEKFESLGMLSAVSRVGFVAIGCYLGHLLRLYELELIPRWPAWLTARPTVVLAALAHLLVLSLPALALFSLELQQELPQADAVLFAISILLLQVLWLTLNSLLFINWFTVGNRTAFARFASGPFWYRFNKLGFSIYLVHWQVLMHANANFEQAVPYGFEAEAQRMMVFGLASALLLGLAVYLLFEAPLAQLSRHFITGRARLEAAPREPASRELVEPQLPA